MRLSSSLTRMPITLGCSAATCAALNTSALLRRFPRETTVNGPMTSVAPLWAERPGSASATGFSDSDSDASAPPPFSASPCRAGVGTLARGGTDTKNETLSPGVTSEGTKALVSTGTKITPWFSAQFQLVSRRLQVVLEQQGAVGKRAADDLVLGGAEVVLAVAADRMAQQTGRPLLGNRHRLQVLSLQALAPVDGPPLSDGDEVDRVPLLRGGEQVEKVEDGAGDAQAGGHNQSLDAFHNIFSFPG